MFMIKKKPVIPVIDFILKALNSYASLPGVAACDVYLFLTEDEKRKLQENSSFKHIKFNFINKRDEQNGNKLAIILKSIETDDSYGLELSVFRNGSVEQRLIIPKSLETKIINTEGNEFNLPLFCDAQDLFICIDKKLCPQKRNEIETYIKLHTKSAITLYEVDTTIKDEDAWKQMVAVSTAAKKLNFNRRGIFVAVGGVEIQNIVGVTARTFRRGASSLYYPLSIADLEQALKLNPRITTSATERVLPFYPASTIVVEQSINQSRLENVTLAEKLADCFTVKEISDALNPDNSVLVEACTEKKLLIVIDRKFYEAHKEKVDIYLAKNRQLQQKSYRILLLDGGDENKNQEALKKIISIAHEAGIHNQQGVLLAFGGGVILDTVGAAAALLDVEYVRVPTTLLGVIDAAIGIKTGINLNAKNDFGAFYKPRAVFYDLEFIKTEDIRNIQSGLAEMIKIFIVTDPVSFYLLNEYYRDFLNKKFNKTTSKLIVAAIYCMLHQLQPNIYEDKTLERLADFGHEIGHIFEYKSAFRLLHGEAVSLGMAVASTVAYQRGLLPQKELDKILTLLDAIGLPIMDELYGADQGVYIEEKMKDSKANKGGDSAVVAPIKVGQGTFLRDIGLEELQQAFSYLIKQKEQFELCKLHNPKVQVIFDEYNNTQAQPSIVFDIGGTNLRAGVYLSNGTLVYEDRSPTPSIKSMPHASLMEIQHALIKGIKDYIDRAKKQFPYEPLEQVIISFAGTLDNGVVLKSASLWGEITNVPLQKMLTDNIPNMRFTLINDVIAAAWRYGTDPHYSQLSNICIFTLSTGIGAAYFDIGEQNQDKDVISIGHKKKFHHRHSLQCDCGEYGHLEPYVSGRGSLHQMIRTAIEAVKFDVDRELFQESLLYKSALEKLNSLSFEEKEKIIHDTYINKILREKNIDEQRIADVKAYILGELHSIDSVQLEGLKALACALFIDNKLLCAAINQKDPFVEPLFREIVQYIGAEICEIALTNTDRIILMGGFARAIKERLEVELNQFCLKKNIPQKRVDTLFNWAEDDDNDGILGAAYYGDQPRRLWSLFNRIISEKAKLQIDLNQSLEEKKLRKAFEYAYYLHVNRPKHTQYKFRSEEPARYFVWHPVELARDVVRKLLSTDTELISAAFLHDSLEYTEVSAEVLEQEFGECVVNIARDLSQHANLLSMSLFDLEQLGFSTMLIGQHLGFEQSSPLDVEQVKMIANIATKIEHYSRLLDGPLDSRSQLLKILDNINNYSSIDRLPKGVVKPRTDVELLLFKLYVDKLQVPQAIATEAYQYIDKLLITFGYPGIESMESKKREMSIAQQLFQPWCERNKKAIKLVGKSLYYGDSLSDACERLSSLKNKNFLQAMARLKHPNTLPISRNQFLKQLRQGLENLKGSDFELALNLCAQTTFDEIKSKFMLPGHYGRFSSNLTSAQLLSGKETIVYFPNDKKATVTPEKKYVDPVSGQINPLITAMDGSEELWQAYLEGKELDEETLLFYHHNKSILDQFMQDKTFIDYHDSFYAPERLVPFTLQLPNGKVQDLCLFESNASQIVGGQFMFVSPSNISMGETENVINQVSSISKMLDFRLLTGRFPSEFSKLDVGIQDVVEKMNPVLSTWKRASTSSIEEKPFFFHYPQKKGFSPQVNIKKRLLPLDNHSRYLVKTLSSSFSTFPMDVNSHAEYMFLIAASLKSSYAVFQNSSDTASVPGHYHCYALDKTKFLNNGQAVYTIPLFAAKANSVLVEMPELRLEKMQWEGACYRLTVPLHRNVKNYAEAVTCIRLMQGLANKLIPMNDAHCCELTFVANRKDDCVELYIGIRKHFKNYPLENSLAKHYGLQPPFNGALEFAGVNTMKNQEEFDKYNELYKKLSHECGKEKADEMLVAIQNESLLLAKPDETLLMEFENGIMTHFTAKPHLGEGLRFSA
ncbi:3-dehydroquinate synthase [Legionella brunensis]|uniref:3-dehydroquinate synthase n=2 Tax=Legionella brunensis TaxID=29422 RepID=A0A0W0SV50_9GAMM|nr:3-dehydroquinate synthase [Legionella brunensis]